MNSIRISVAFLISFLMVQNIGQNLATAQSNPQFNDLTSPEQIELQQLRQEKILQSQLQAYRWEWLTALIVFWVIFSLISILSFWKFERHLLQKMGEVWQASFQSLETKLSSPPSINSELELDQFISLAEFSSQIALLEAKMNELQQELIVEQEELRREISQIQYDFNQLNSSHLLMKPGIEMQETISEVLEEEPINLSLEDHLKIGNLKYIEQDYIEATIAYNKALKMNPDLAEVRYKNACAYAMIGRTNPAIGNLQWAIDLEGEYRLKAKQETAFDSLRFDSQFKQLINAEDNP